MSSPRHEPLDLSLVVLVASLVGLGLVMVASASMGVADRLTDDPLFYIKHQLVFAALGVVAISIIYRLPLVYWQTIGPVMLLAAVVLLLLVLMPGIGKSVNGSTRWLPLGPLNLQVSELVKLLMIVYLAGYLVRHGGAVRATVSGFLRPVLVVTSVCILLLLEPNFGAIVVLMATTLGMLFLGGVRVWQFAALLTFSLLTMAAVAISSPYRLERITSFLNPWAHPFDSGFQLTQSLIAVGSGGWFGVGLGDSIQKLFYLPEAHTDFLFAILGEELGLVGVIVVVALFTLLVWRSFDIGGRAEHKGLRFAAYTAYGIGIWIGLQAFINMGVNLGVLPTKGLTLPLMSAGGSSMLVVCAAMGLLLRIHRETCEGAHPSAAVAAVSHRVVI